jgi:hypothetical protein
MVKDHGARGEEAPRQARRDVGYKS